MSKKFELSEENLSELIDIFELSEFINTSERIPDIILKLVNHAGTQLQIPTGYKFSVSGKISNRENSTHILPSDCVGRIIYNFNCKEIYGIVRDNVEEYVKNNKVKLTPEKKYVLTNGDNIIIRKNDANKTIIMIDKNPRQKIVIPGRELAFIRPRNYRRLTIVIDFIENINLF
jgi:hypothetical protein